MTVNDERSSSPFKEVRSETFEREYLLFVEVMKRYGIPARARTRRACPLPRRYESPVAARAFPPNNVLTIHLDFILTIFLHELSHEYLNIQSWPCIYPGSSSRTSTYNSSDLTTHFPHRS